MKTLIALALLTCSLTATAGKAFPDDQWPISKSTNVEDKIGRQPSVEMDIKWVRAWSPVSEVRDGTCYIYSPDDERSLVALGAQVRQCVAAGAHVTNDQPIEGARRVRLFFAADQFESTDMLEHLFGSLNPPSIWISSRGVITTRGSGHSARFALGSYFDPHADINGACYVFAIQDAIGHELKHCFDGLFHGVGGRWRESAR